MAMVVRRETSNLTLDAELASGGLRTKWWARQDSNLRHNRYERFVLTN